MVFIIWSVIVFISFFIGVFAYSQIVGSIQNIKQRGFVLTLITISIWSLILFFEYKLAIKFISNQIMAFYIGNAISFIAVISQGKIE